MAATKDPNNPGTPPEQPPKKLKRHVEFRELTVDEIKRARDEGAYLMMPASCACVVEGGVYGKLIVL